MGRKCYISFKMEDVGYKEDIQELGIDMIDKTLDEPIDSDDPDYIMQKIRDDYLSDSSVTIHLIGTCSGENCYGQDQTYIKRELQASLYNGKGNTRSGILGIVLPSMTDKIYTGSGSCSKCGLNIGYVNVAGNTVKEFSYNYHIPNDKCHWTESDRYCVMVKWDEFVSEPEHYIEKAYAKINDPISKKIKVYP